MISTSNLLELGGPRKTGRGTSPFQGKANALAGGHRGSGGVIHWDGPGDQKDNRQVRAEMDDHGLPYFVILELVRGRGAYCPSDGVPWGSTDFDTVHLERVWFFEEFVLLKNSHTPSTTTGGQPWVKYTTIPHSDTYAIDDLCDRTGLAEDDLVAMSILLDRHS